MLQEYIEVKSNGLITPKKGVNSRIPYKHQMEAMKRLTIINQEDSFSTLIVLPTGGGKTYTASNWLLKNAIDSKKKILWIAHRHMLLNQAAESFQKYAYTDNMPHISSFSYRIISGDSNHGRVREINQNDQILIISKDSLGRNIAELDRWLMGEDEIFFVIDEAHHSTAKTYRKILSYIKERVKNVKLIGLTATPFRTAQEEAGLLSKIYSDGVDQRGRVVRGEKGITYQIGLKELISSRILSKPIFEQYYTDENFGESLGLNGWEKIQHLDIIPDDVASEIAENATRNKYIVEQYKRGKKKYGQTIVFAVNKLHAITLSALFNKSGVKCDFIVSDIYDRVTGVKISKEENEVKLQKFKDGELQVLVNVNILTEGVDLPQIKTVFLARPTVSTILMTQMIGRALRGTAAGGTAEAYIVSFIDNWNEHIAWVNPETLFDGNNDFVDSKADYASKAIRSIALTKIEEFARILDDSIDTMKLESIPFMQRVPIGMYVFNYLEENGMDLSYQVMVYDSTKEAYEQLMESLSELFKVFAIEQEYLDESTLRELEEQCRSTFFSGEMLPPYESRDIDSILKYYAQYEESPSFYTFEEVDRSKLDITKIAQHIWDNDLGPRKKTEYLDTIWNNGDENMLRLYFCKKIYFLKQLDIELIKISSPELYEEENDNIIYGRKCLEDLTLTELGNIYPNYEKDLRDATFNKAQISTGEYECAYCKLKSFNRIPFQVDHIVPMNKGGKTKVDNLQILCRRCNGKKGDR